MKRLVPLLLLLTGCVANPDRLTLAELKYVEADLAEVDVTHSLELAMEGYRQFLANTEVNAQTPEALRRLADLKIEQEFGAHVGPARIERPDFSGAGRSELLHVEAAVSGPVDAADIDASIAARSATSFGPGEFAGELADQAGDGLAPFQSTSPREAIAIYQRILRDYPYYARSDQVLYQMARAYDELGEPEAAMEVMDRLVSRFPQSRFNDEVYFRRGEFHFVRRQYLAAEESYGAIIAMGKTSDFYELARYKMGWSLYKQELYEEALHHYLALLDFKLEQGYDFDAEAAVAEAAVADTDAATLEEERRVADTFRVVSLRVLQPRWRGHSEKLLCRQRPSRLRKPHLSKPWRVLRRKAALQRCRGSLRVLRGSESSASCGPAVQHAGHGDLCRRRLPAAGGGLQAKLCGALRAELGLLAALCHRRATRGAGVPENQPKRSGAALPRGLSG